MAQEWVDQIGDPESRASREIAAKRKYKLPKEAFKLYTSSELHTKTSQRIPTYVYVAGLAVLSLIGSVLYVWNTIDKKLSPDPVVEEGGIFSALSGSDDISSTTTSQPKELTYMQAFEPRISGLPHTAPVYDTISYAPVTAPFPSACVASQDTCTCYTNQSTKIAMEEDLCRSIANGGLFDLSQRSAPRVSARLRDSPDVDDIEL